MKKMNPVVHFEMPAKNMKRMAEFYQDVFGWKTQFLGKEMGNYTVVSTTETDNNGRPKMAGAINGGFFPADDNRPNLNPSIVIAVDDINECLKSIVDKGGKVFGPPTPIPGIGIYATFVDTEGNMVSVLQPQMV